MSRKRRFRFFVRPEETRRDIDDELQFHLDMKAKKFADQGIGTEAAEAEARRRFGDVNAVRNELVSRARRRRRRRSRGSWLSDVRRDFEFGIRSLRKSPGFSAVAVVTLALGMGATTAVFSIVNAVLLQPLPFAEPKSLFVVRPVDQGVETVAAPGLLSAFRESGVFSVLGSVGEVSVTVVADGLPRRSMAYNVSDDYFTAAGVAPLHGRTFTDAEDVFGSGDVVVLSHRVWARDFGGDPEVVGRVVRIDGAPHTVVGVMPEALDIERERGDLWLPQALSPGQQRNMGGARFVGMGRLAEGVSVQQAEERLTAIIAELDVRSDRDGSLLGARLVASSRYYGRDVAPQLWGLMLAVVFVLLIGCINLANLLLARGAVRAEELAIRKALGASRGRLVRQLLVENFLLAVAGAAAGLLVAHWSAGLLVSLTPADIPRLGEAGLNAPVFGFAIGMAFATPLVFGLLPALRVSRVPSQEIIKRAGRGGDTMARPDLLRRTLVVAEVALSLVLVCAAGLMLRTVWELSRVDTGVDGEVLTLQVALPWSSYPQVGDALRTFRELAEEIEAVPGVDAVALASRVPLAGANMGLPFAAEEDAFAPASQAGAAIRIVSPGYFGTMGIPLLEGRDLGAGDVAGSPRAVVVNQALIDALDLGPAPVGRRIKADGGDFRAADGTAWPWEIVGVAADVRDAGAREAAIPEVYFSGEQVPEGPWNWSGRQLVIAARVSGDAALLVGPIRSAVGRVDADLPVDDVRTMGERVSGSVALERFGTLLLSLLGGLALLLASVGILGVVSYLVGRRTPEIGVRLALGASPRAVQWLVIGQSMRPVVLGLVFGVVGAAQAARLLRGVVFGIPETDPGTFAAAVACLGLMALVASWVPARRAARIDPVETLRRG